MSNINNSNNSNNSNDSLVISFYLLKKCKLWVWDFDDTLIDTKYYYTSNMNPDKILNRTNKELDNEVPQWKYFKRLITYLVQNGKHVAIASFGTYEIIKAYMDRILGFNQTFFTNKNLIAPTYTDRKCRGFQIPPNKNEYIYKIMKMYKIEDFPRVVLFDDLPSNIADAIGIGIIAIQIATPNNGDKNGDRYADINQGNGSGNGSGSGSNMFFGPWVMEKIDKKIVTECGQELYLNRTFTGVTNNTSDTSNTSNTNNTNNKIYKKCDINNCNTNKNRNKLNASCFKGISYDQIDFNNGVQEIFNPVVFGTALGNRKISTNAEYRWNKMNVSNSPNFVNGNWEKNVNMLDSNMVDSTIGGQSLSFWDNKHKIKKNGSKDGNYINTYGIIEGFDNIISETCKPFEWNWIVLLLIIIILIMIIIIYKI